MVKLRIASSDNGIAHIINDLSNHTFIQEGPITVQLHPSLGERLEIMTCGTISKISAHRHVHSFPAYPLAPAFLSPLQYSLL